VVFGTKDDLYLTVGSKQLAGDAYGWLVQRRPWLNRITCSPNFLHAGWIRIRRLAWGRSNSPAAVTLLPHSRTFLPSA